MSRLSMLDEAALRARLPMGTAIEAIHLALRSGLDPSADPARTVLPADHGQILLMPSLTPAHAGVKLVTVTPDNPERGLPRVQGVYLLLDALTLTPQLLLDGAALTAIRTPAVSAAAADLIAVNEASRLVVFGTGPQAWGHVEALRVVRPISDVTVVGRDGHRVADLVARCVAAGLRATSGTSDAVADADLVACCTTSRTPLFDGGKLAPHATVLAIGSHEADAREVDTATVARCEVVVEDVATALREAGDVIIPVDEGALRPGALIPLTALARGERRLDPSTPKLFKSVGMAWQDLAVAATVG
ncbi:ornithine cyclodeaminase family protein [Allokutzneria albata]|uniref:Ornithine cyclodeaminase n=1 Tax=Allokutzneria albata TaxID=211114 RepID=A0A1G9R6B1_ALLAB|nr:ornithine cyclodeaminase family protein [Allokutzneria albata]SDM18377.1 ornithine cyclodeaminase [Allokutzneria albata]